MLSLPLLEDLVLGTEPGACCDGILVHARHLLDLLLRPQALVTGFNARKSLKRAVLPAPPTCSFYNDDSEDHVPTVFLCSVHSAALVTEYRSWQGLLCR